MNNSKRAAAILDHIEKYPSLLNELHGAESYLSLVRDIRGGDSIYAKTCGVRENKLLRWLEDYCGVTYDKAG